LPQAPRFAVNADWLTITGSDTTAYLERGEFDRIHQLLQTEAPLFLTSINLIGLRAFNLSTGTEFPGEGPADDEALVWLVATIRQHLADTGSPVPPE
jgi:hypothetical protein